METVTPRVAPAVGGPTLTEHVNVLMTPDTRAFLLGSKIADDARGEGVVARALLESAIATFAQAHPNEYAHRRAMGRAELARRSAGA
jgi:hypothetical protein